MNTPSQKLVVIGKIVAAHGIQGQVKIKVFIENPLDINKYGPVQNGDGSSFFQIKPLHAKGDVVVVSLKSVTDRNQAEALRGTELYVGRENFPELDDNTFYNEDLIGLEVHNSTGKSVGIIISVQNFGAGDLLEIQDPETFQAIFVPFRDEAVPTVDLEKGVFVVEDSYLEDLGE
jgi:16S rRNA processing protein RimM